MNTEQKFNCIFCKDSFDNKEELQVHFRKHADPQFKRRAGSDTQVSEEKLKEKSEMVGCDVCSQMFPTISKAITHKHKMHPDHDVKYFCPWCGKLFTMKHPYNIHVETSHEEQEQTDNKIFHCDSCDVDFFLPSAVMYHNKFFHRQDTDIPDVGMSKKLKLYNQEVLQLYYCAFCGEEYENKVNLFKHLSDDHSDENQSPEEVLRCPLCEAIFYHLDAYEVHLSFHSTEDLYSHQNELFGDLLDFSLETVPPVIEKVETREDFEAEVHSHDTDADSNINALGIEKFLELAMDQTEDSNSGKVKKKKHKKSKKPAITLDEFLSMNQDVFGEDLDFQGVEELPTRVVKKRIKSNKKSVNSETSAELEKLKEKGIVVMKVGTSKATKATQKKMAKKSISNRELKTSSEVLTKLINQSNNQIKIVKKAVPTVVQTEALTMEDNTNEGNEIQTKDKFGEDAGRKKIDEAENNFTKPDNLSMNDNKNTLSPKIEQCLSSISPIKTASGVAINKNTGLLHADHEANLNISNRTSNQNYVKEGTVTCNNDDNLEKASKGAHESLPRVKIHKSYLKSLNTTINKQITKNQSDFEESDSEMVEKTNLADTEGVEFGNKHINELQGFIDKNKLESNIKPLVSSLSTIKHLSHLTVKPINQINTSPEYSIDKGSESKQSDKFQIKIDKESTPSIVSTDNDIATTNPKSITDKDPTLDALKNLSKNITIKSLPISPKSTVNESNIDEKVDEIITKTPNDMKLKDVSANKNVTIKKIKIEANEPASTKMINVANNSSTNAQSLMPMNKVIKSSLEIQSSKNNDNEALNSPSKTNTNILKHLLNVTTKPVPSKTITKPQVKQINTSVKAATTTKDHEIIEISDIDESDNETDYIQQPEPKRDLMISDPLKNLSKHIIVKSVHQTTQPVLKNIKVEKTEEHTDEEDFPSNEFDLDADIPSIPKVCSQKLSNKSVAFKNALKNLGKNITVKSRNSSPSQSHKSQDHYSQDSNIDVNEACDDLDHDIGKVNITELEDPNINNHNSYEDNSDLEDDANQPIVESPHDSFSENDEIDEDLLDFESEINATTVLKTNQEATTNKNTLCLNNLKNISKSLTIKTLNSNISDVQQKPKPTVTQESIASAKNNRTPIKPTKPLLKETCNDDSRNLRKVANFGDQTSNESLNQKVSVNKEVTVKTFQTKTVIQEITTTVTKTIKTVNQTVKQEMRNSNQMNIPVMPQRVQGMRPSTSKNLQGVVIRQAAPAAVRPNNIINQIRPTGTVGRPSKQVVPMKPGLNIQRPSTPRMPAKTNLPKSSPNKQVIGKPLKFSPSAIASATAKRANTEDMSGPFSCFKKPKESLIPGIDVTANAGSGDTVVAKATSQTSSNYMSTSKVVKGHSIVTSMQMKSEVSSSMQQLSRVSNTIGINVQSAQIKQSQVQESETNSKKRTTLEAIERLQKQGLLVKKPRIEDNEHSDFDDNVGIGYSSGDEHD